MNKNNEKGSSQKTSQKNFLKRPNKKLSDSKIEVLKKERLPIFNGRKYSIKNEKIKVNSQNLSANASQNKKSYFLNEELPPLIKRSFNQQEFIKNFENIANTENTEYFSPNKKCLSSKTPKTHLIKHKITDNNKNNIFNLNDNSNNNNSKLTNEFRKPFYKNYFNLNNEINSSIVHNSPIIGNKISLNPLKILDLDDDNSNNNYNTNNKPKNVLSQSFKSNKLNSSNKKKFTKFYLQSINDNNISNKNPLSKSNNCSIQRKMLDNEYIKNLDKINLGNAYSEAGTLEDGTIKVNQDSYIILNNIFDIDYNIFGILDGHGNYGHLASQYVVKKLSEIFTNEGIYNFKNKREINTEKIFEKLSYKNCEFIKNIINNINKDIMVQNEFNVNYSGTTCNLLFQIGRYFICSNTGDSRCLLFKSSLLDKKKNEIENFSYDHKPILEKEKKRIDKLGGCVHQTIDYEGEFTGPYRVWVKDEEYPGIAVSRSIGDNVAEKIGVISDPDFIIKSFESSFNYCVLGSDGVWDVLTGKDLINLICPFFEILDGEGAAKRVVDEAIKLWGKKGKLRDDITCIVVFLNLPQSMNKKYKYQNYM